MYARGEELRKVVTPKAAKPRRSELLNLISRNDAAVCSCLVYPSLGLSVRNSGRFPFRKKPGNFGGSKSGISDW